MFACISREKDQKDLYFSLYKLFSIQYEKRKVRGVYVIYKDVICLYVGQSSNIASRLATHLSGKYEKADRVVIFEIDQDEQHDLIPSEKYAIQRFKPIENVLADHSEVIPNDFISEIFQPLNNGTRFFYSHQILLNNHYIFIDDSQMYFDFQSFKGMALYVSEIIKEAIK